MECLTKFCVCLCFLMVTVHGVSAALLQKCDTNTPCTGNAGAGDPNAVCETDTNLGGDADGNCICTGTYKNNANNDGCVAKVITNNVCTDNAAGNTKCEGVDPNTKCSTDKCSCKDNYFLSTDTTQCVQSILEITCTPGDTGNTKCETQDKNTECPTGSTTCNCKADHFLSSDKKQCVQSIKEITCTPGDTGNTKCDTQAPNAECHSSSTCACKATFYLNSDKKTCKQKITTVTCTPADATDGDTKCQQVDAKSECKTGSTTCTCMKGYIGTDSCTKVLEGTCTGNTDCTDSVENSVCSTETNKCECGSNFIEESAVCKTAVGQGCTGTGQGDCVSNAECDQTCKCSSGFKDTNGMCAAESYATSAWMTTSLLATSLLIFLPRFICG